MTYKPTANNPTVPNANAPAASSKPNVEISSEYRKMFDEAYKGLAERGITLNEDERAYFENTAVTQFNKTNNGNLFGFDINHMFESGTSDFISILVMLFSSLGGMFGQSHPEGLSDSIGGIANNAAAQAKLVNIDTALAQTYEDILTKGDKDRHYANLAKAASLLTGIHRDDDTTSVINNDGSIGMPTDILNAMAKLREIPTNTNPSLNRVPFKSSSMDGSGIA